MEGGSEQGGDSHLHQQLGHEQFEEGGELQVRVGAPGKSVVVVVRHCHVLGVPAHVDNLTGGQEIPGQEEQEQGRDQDLQLPGQEVERKVSLDQSPLPQRLLARTDVV